MLYVDLFILHVDIILKVANNYVPRLYFTEKNLLQVYKGHTIILYRRLHNNGRVI